MHTLMSLGLSAVGDIWEAIAPVLVVLAFLLGLPELGTWILGGMIVGAVVGALAEEAAGVVTAIPFMANLGGVASTFFYILFRAQMLLAG